jgi:hypothetical protein
MNEPISGEKAAFPWPKDQSQHLFSLGMTLRDYFAAAALQGLIANGGCPTWDDDAKAAYAAADAMLKAREAK